MIRALVYADLQATDGHERLFIDPTQSLQVWRVRRFFQVLKDIYVQYGCNCQWELGDLLDDRSSIPVPALDAVFEGLSAFPKSDYNIKLIGNHEQYLRNAKIHSGRMFEPYFNVIAQPESFTLTDKIKLVCAPYPADEAELTKWLRAQSEPGIFNLLLGHFQVSGSWGGSGQILSGVPVDALNKFELGMLGHVHRHQQLAGCYYVGSPFQQNWGEAGEDKFVGIVDISNTSEVCVEWVPINGFPKYREVGLKEFIAECGDGSDDRFRVVLKSPQEAAEFYAAKYAQRAEPQYDFEASERKSSTTSEQKTVWTADNVMRRYVDKHPPADRGLQVQSDDLLQVGVDIYTP